jgi:hypothetical protein
MPGRNRVFGNEAVTEPAVSRRQSPKRPPVRIKDLTTLVQVPGRPDAVQAFTDAESDLAAAYAAEVGGAVVSLPLT